MGFTKFTKDEELLALFIVAAEKSGAFTIEVIRSMCNIMEMESDQFMEVYGLADTIAG